MIVLTYHHIDRKFQSPYTITPELFHQQMEFLKKNNFHPLKLKDFYEYMDTGLLTQDNALLITFDDGYESFYKEAFPVLREFGFPATDFAIYENLRDSIARKRENMIPPLTFVEIEEMVRNGLVSIQSHTYGLHEQTDQEVGEGEQAYRKKLYVDFMMARSALAEVTKEPVLGISYPHGYENGELTQVAKDVGYRYGFTGNYGVVRIGINPFLLPRVDMGKPEVDMEYFKKLLMELVYD